MNVNITINEFWKKVVNFFESNWLNIVRFFSILLIGIIVIYIILRFFRMIFRKKKLEPVATKFVISILKFALTLLLILILMYSIGIEITGFTTMISAIVLAVGMALKENIANLANGIILVSSQKYKQGDYVVVAGVEGSIVDINFLFTTLKTPDGKQITLPNGTMVNNPVTNFGAYPKRRVSFELNVAYESDCELVKKVVIDCLKSCDLVDLDPEPNCRLKVLGDSSITFFATCWCDSSDYWDTYYYCLDAIYNEFKRNNISIPYTQLEVRERKDEVVMPYRETALKERVGKVHEKKEKKVSLVDLDEVPLKDINKVIFRKNKKKKEAKKTDEKDKSSKKANTKETKN